MRSLKRTFLVLLLLATVQVSAAERIISFHADIHVQADGAMNVLETITIRAEGRDIKRGIYRDLPTTYRDAAGRRISVVYTHIGVLRDGRPEPHHETVVGNGIRIYMGDQNRFLETGEYTYTLSYRTERQLGFFDDHDELYWNVTGNGWRFPMDGASASVRLPSTVPGAEMVLEAYTGAAGARGRDYEAVLDMDSVAQFRSTRRWRGEGLTIVVSWPKGHVVEPSARQRLDWFVADNAGLVAGAAGLVSCCFTMGCSGAAWVAIHRPASSFPGTRRPKGYSPASMRYVRRMGYDEKSFSSALINLAVKGRLIIHDDDGDYLLERVPGAGTKPAAGEAALLRQLFARGQFFDARAKKS